MAEESAEAGGVREQASVRDHLDNPLIVLVIIGLFVYAMGGVGRAIGNRLGHPGITSFFGG